MNHSSQSPDLTVSVVLPCLNEAQAIGTCVTEAFEGLARSDLSGEVLVVDNGSTDGSAEIAAAAGARVITETVRGVGAALRAGFREAHGEIIVMADADGTYDLASLGALVSPVLEGAADLAVGGRLRGANRRTMPFLHRFVGTPVLSFLLRRVCRNLTIRDSQSGYRAMRADKVRSLDLKATGFEMTSEMLIRSSLEGDRIIEIPLEYRPRVGESKLNTFIDGWRHLLLILLLAPHHLMLWPGVATLVTGLGLHAVSLIRPGGFDLGSLRWQPVFFAPILTVLGTLAILSGAVIAHHSPIAAAHRTKHFAFLREPRFANTSVASGVVVLLVGLAIDLALFVRWVSGGPAPVRGLALAGLAQALVIDGATLVAFGLAYRVVATQSGYLGAPGVVDITQLAADPSSHAGGE